MAISTYSELVSAIARWMARPTDTDLAARAPDFIALAEARFNRELRLRAMETSFSQAITAGVVAVPADWREWKQVQIVASSGTWALQPVNLETLYTLYPTRSTDSTPVSIAREGANFIFGPFPDGNYTVTGIYYAALAALSASSTTNWMLTNAPDAYLFGALVEGFGYIMDEARQATAEGRLQAALSSLQMEERRQHVSGGALRQRAF